MYEHRLFVLFLFHYHHWIITICKRFHFVCWTEWLICILFHLKNRSQNIFSRIVTNCFFLLRPISISVDAIHFDWYIYTSKIKCRALKLVSLSLFNPAKDDGDDNDHIQISEIACRWVPAMESLGLPKLMCIHIVSRTKPPQPHQQPLFYVIYKLDFIKYKYEYFNFLPQRKWFTIYSNAY